MTAISSQTASIHGHSISYLEAGSGPVLLLIHGIAGSKEVWGEVIEPLAQAHTVIAPDLPGHGASAPAGGDYSLGALAAGLRDLLIALGHDRATLVGHSLGGGITMQFAYQFPEQIERLVLVASGGLGTEVNPILRAAALPGAELFISATSRPGRAVGSALARWLAAIGMRPNVDVAEFARGYASLADRERREAFLATLRSVVGTSGQRVEAVDRLYLAQGMPVLIMWGENDPIIPAEHGITAHQTIPQSRLELFAGVGHMPQLEAPARFVAALNRFLAETAPEQWDTGRWRSRLRESSDERPGGAPRGKGGGARALPRAPARAKRAPAPAGG